MRVRAPQRARVLTRHVPAPIGGINTVAVGTDMPASDSIYSYNLIGAEYGLRSRLGSREWVTGLDTDPRSILAFNGSPKSGSNDRLFAATQAGIWNCSSSSSSPGPKVVTFGTQNTDSGWGIGCAFTDLNGAHWLLYCDEANGYWTYAEATSTWTQVAQGAGAGQINGVNPANFCFVMIWKNRVWFVERDTQRAWYLPIGQLYGTAQPFTFGTQFKRGGDLRGLWSWTDTGGQTIDDRLVAISGAGDIVIYAGTDPAQATTFGIQGIWYVGAVPVGRRIATDSGGDLLIMTSTGIVPLSKIVNGSVLYDRSQYSTYKIGNLFNQLQAATATVRGWAMRLHPLDAALMVLVPQALNAPSQQLAMSLSTRGWHQYRDMPMGVCAEPWGGTLYFGSGDGSGRVLVNDGYVDGVTLADPTSYTPIEWSGLTAFSNLGDPRQKRIHVIREHILSQGGAVAFQAAAKFGFDLSELALPSGSGQSAGAVWDGAKWDQAVWGGGYQAQSQSFGSVGCGPNVAIAFRGNTTSRMTLIGFDVALEMGGFR